MRGGTSVVHPGPDLVEIWSGAERWTMSKGQFRQAVIERRLPTGALWREYWGERYRRIEGGQTMTTNNSELMVWTDGAAIGPFELSVLTGMVESGEVNRNALTAPPGSDDWVPLSSRIDRAESRPKFPPLEPPRVIESPLACCDACGHSVSKVADACPHCGHPVAGGRRAHGSAGNAVAAIASFILPGLGQLAQGRVGAAAIVFILAALFWVVALGWVIHIWSAVDAATWYPGRRGNWL